MGYAANPALGSFSDWGLPELNTVGDWIAGLQGKITPSDEQIIRQEATAAIIRAGGNTTDVAEVQADITAALGPSGGSSLPEYGGSIFPAWVEPNFPWIAAGVLGLVLILRR